MDTPIRSFQRGDLRVSDAERDQAVAELSEHYQAGRLSIEEFEDRSGRALQAKTGSELSNLFTDLPESTAPAASTGAGPASAAGPAGPAGVRRPRPQPVARIVLLCVIAAIVAGNVLGQFGHGHGGFGFLIPVIVLAIIVRGRCFGRR